MSTAANLIERAQRLIGQLAVGASPSTAEYAIGLIALNAMLDSWRNERLLCFTTRDESLTLSANVASYTIGPSGTLNTTRPVAIEQAWMVVAGVSYPVDLISDAQYAAIPSKTDTGDWPTKANYRPSMSTGTLYVWPVPKATRTMTLRTRTPLTAFSSPADTVVLPPGWEEALAFNLAIELAAEYETDPRATVIKRATESLAAIKVLNSQPVLMQTELASLLGGTGKSNILSDGQ